MEKTGKALCILMIQPTHEIAAFYNGFSNYHIVFILDDSSFDCSEFRKSYTNIEFVQIPDEVCFMHGFKWSSYMPKSSIQMNEIIAWDRALYYFCWVKPHFENVWFLEDDVFIYDEETVENLDAKYPESDLLCRDMTPEPSEGQWDWFWPCVSLPFQNPYFRSMICAVRMSQTMLQRLSEYIANYRKMTFIEALFPSLAFYHSLKIDTPREFEKIEWCRDWMKDTTIFKSDFVHPVKNRGDHVKLRIHIITNDTGIL